MFPPKNQFLPTSPHGVSVQKTNIDISTAVRTSDRIQVVLSLVKYSVSHISLNVRAFEHHLL